MTGKPMDRRILAGMIWPTNSYDGQMMNLKNLISGKTKRVDFHTVLKICKALNCDPNYLYNWNFHKER